MAMKQWFGALCAAMVLCLPASGQPADAPVASTRPLADFARLPRVEGPQLSPDGKALVAKVAIDGKQHLATIPLDGAKPRVLALGDVDLNWWNWVNDHWVIVGIGQLIPFEGDEFYVSRALAINVETGKLVQLAPRDAAQNGSDVIWTAHDGSARIMLSYQSSFYLSDPGFWSQVVEIDLDTGRRRTVQPPRTGVMSWYADAAGTLRIGIMRSDNGRTTRVLYRDKPGQSFREIDRATKTGDSVTVPALFLPDGKRALVIEDDEAGMSALYELDLATMTRGKQLFATKGFDIGGVVVDGDGSGALGVRVNADQPRTHWLDADMIALEGDVAGQVKGGQVRVTSVSRDHAHAIVHIGSPDAAGAYMLYDRGDKSLAQIGYVNDAFKLGHLHPVRTIRYKARDGLEIAAVLTTPRNRTGPLPLIVMPHGGPFSRDTEEWDWWTQFLADRGYAVVQPNYRGSSGYGTPFTAKGEGQWGLAMQDDLDDAVGALAAQGIADPKRVCMVGASYGGYAAMRAAQRSGARYRCAVSYAGVSDLPGMLRYDGQFLMSGARKDWMRTQAPDLRAVSPSNAAASFSTPILLVHGKADRVVPVQQSRLLAGRLRNAGKDVTYIEQPLADHHFSRAEDRQQFLEALEAFLAKHNPV